MDNYFNSSRFFNLLKKYTRENWSFYLMSLLVLAGIMLLFFSFVAYESNGALAYQSEIQFIIYVVCFLLSGSIFSSTVFSHFGDRKSGVMSFMLPCSRFEKFLVGWVFAFIVFPLLYTLVFYLIDWLTISSISLNHTGHIEYHNVLSLESDRYMIFIIYLLLGSVAFWGSIVFDSLHFIKIGAVAFILGFVITLANTFFLDRFITETIGGLLPFGGITFKLKEEYERVNIDSDLNYMIGTVCAIVPMLWLSTYYKLKEKEV